MRFFSAEGGRDPDATVGDNKVVLIGSIKYKVLCIKYREERDSSSV